MNPGRKLSAGGVVFRTSGDAAQVALISTPGGKKWGLPKGLVEEGENIARTAHREVKEETGLDGKILENLGHIEYFYSHKEGDRVDRYFKIVYFFLMEYTGGDVADHDTEVDDCRWFDIDEAAGLLKYEDERGMVEKARERIVEFGYIGTRKD